MPELVTTVLKDDTYRRMVKALLEFFEELGVRAVSVSYGWGCDCPEAELYEPKEMPLPEVMSFIARAEVAEYYPLGHADLHLVDAEDRIRIRLCHESDIHVQSEDARWIELVREFWRGCNVSIAGAS